MKTYLLYVSGMPMKIGYKVEWAEWNAKAICVAIDLSE